MPIPPFDKNGNLPPGVHSATWAEFADRFGTTPHRKRLLAGLRMALESLGMAGCETAYINGSFVTDKIAPSDFDGCWELRGVDPQLLDQTLLDFGPGRLQQKLKYGGELFLADSKTADVGVRFLQFFQMDKYSGEPKGIVALSPKELMNR